MAFPEQPEFVAGGNVVIFGAGGGIGCALVDVLRNRRDLSGVIGFSRSSYPAIDLLNEASLKEAAAFAAAQGDIRIVVDATGFLHDETHQPEKSWRDLDPSQMARSETSETARPIQHCVHQT